MPTSRAIAQTPSAAESPSLDESSEVDSRLFLAGMEDPEEVRAFLANLRQSAVMRGSRQARLRQRQALVAMVRYPFTTYDEPGVPGVTYHRPEALLRDFERVFTPPVLNAMRHAQYEELFINGQGAMISDGRVWFDQREDGIKIKAINP
ncbi:MAG TPA: hypothetical protein V6C88_15845 [Chroococcidiopsis sp.]